MASLLELGVESDDDGDWVSVFAEAPKTQQTSLTASSTETTMVAVPKLVFRRKVPKEEPVAFVGRADWSKRLGKRKSADSSRERSKRHDLESRQRRKKLLALEERLGIELAHVKTDSVAPATSSWSSSFSGSLKAFRAKRAKLCRREKGVGCSSVLKHLAHFKSTLFAALVFLLLSTLVLFLVPPKLGLLSKQQHGADSLSFIDAAGKWQKEPPQYVAGREGSSNPGRGTSPTPYLHPVQHKGTSNISSEIQPLELNQQTGRFFSTGKCTEMFQYKAIAPRGGIVPAVSHMIRGATPAAPSSMKVSILPRKPGGRDSVFVVVVVDGVKYYTYSCSLPQQISP